MNGRRDELHIVLKANEAEYLQNTLLGGTSDQLIKQTGDQKESSPVVVLQRSELETIREQLTVRLAEVGFDQNYVPTREGVFLEDLIDRLNLDSEAP